MLTASGDALTTVGFGGLLEINDNIALQGILTPFGDLRIHEGRGIYRFRSKGNYSPYAYGALDLISVNIDIEFISFNVSVLALGAGAGIQFDLKEFGQDLPPIEPNLELGIVIVGGLTLLVFQAGAHYYF